MRFAIYCIPYNEEWLLPKMVEWYRSRLSGHEVTFHILDNESTDDTRKVAKELGCNVTDLFTGNEIRDDIYRFVFNNIWKGSLVDYVIMISTDEFIDIDPDKLGKGTIYRCIGYNMINDGSVDIMDISEGVRYEPQDKCCIFSPQDITDINFTPGAHYCNPEGNVIWDSYRPLMYHMNMISKEWMVSRYERGRNRLSKVNKDNGWGKHYGDNNSEIERLWEHAWNLKQKVR